MQFFDLHCDTLYKAVSEKSSLNNSLFQVSIDSGKKFTKWYQCTAIWLPDDITDDDADRLFKEAYKKLLCDAKKYSIDLLTSNNSFKDYNLIFTIENGRILKNDLSVIDYLAKCSVRMLTLTWNAENCIGGGADSPHKGLSSFGKACIKKLEENNIIVDISHASDKTLSDVLSIANKPVVASHSDSRTVCNHRRNLSDEFFIEITKRGGIVGINFHRDFLSEDPASASIKDVLLHTEHFLSLGGEDSISIGSDFDGSDIPKDLNNLQKIPNLYESFLKIGYNEQLVQKIMYTNAYNFFSRF